MKFTKKNGVPRVSDTFKQNNISHNLNLNKFYKFVLNPTKKQKNNIGVILGDNVNFYQF